MKSYEEITKSHYRANILIQVLTYTLGRSGQCGTLNPAIGYVLRQEGFKTRLISGHISCPVDSDLSISERNVHMEAGYHLWNLVSDGKSLWHVDATNNFYMNKWFTKNLSSQYANKIGRGPLDCADPFWFIPIETLPPIWGYPSSYGLDLDATTITYMPPHFDVLDKVGKKNVVQTLFAAYGFSDPYSYYKGILETEGLSVPI